MAIKIIFCDIGNVLIRNNNQDLYQKYQKIHHLDPDKLKSVFQFLHSSPRTNKDLENYLLSQGITPSLWKQFSEEAYGSEVRNQSLIKLLEDLKNNFHIKIACTTNNVSDVTSILQKHQIDSLPDLIITSASIGFSKPSPDFWYQAVKESQKLIPGIQYQEILVIDDSYSNTVSAQEFGFQTVHYQAPQSDIEIASRCAPDLAEDNVILSTPEDIHHYLSNQK